MEAWYNKEKSVSKLAGRHFFYYLEVVDTELFK